MLRLCGDSSRSYPGRSVRLAALWAAPRMATLRVTGQKSAEVIVGEGETSCGPENRRTPPRLATVRAMVDSLPRPSFCHA